MFKKMSFLVVALFATALMGCEQQKKQAEPAAQVDETQAAGQENAAGGKIENAESGALNPGLETPAPAPAPAPEEGENKAE